MMLMQQRQQQQQLPPSTGLYCGTGGGGGVVAAPPHCPPYLLFPKPYMAPKIPPAQQLAAPVTAVGGVGGVPRNQPIAYNQNHWLLQEAELRRQLESIEVAQRLQQQQQPVSGAPIPSANIINNNNNTVNNNKSGNTNNGGYLSVSGKKRCSSCGEELGKGCAAMVVESLSLYYHINCFRCSVCNVQLGKYYLYRFIFHISYIIISII